ncbi:hypothetical protein JR316_0006823 [Psilocybe cubensis]|uniref:Uncharacterized protein n=2 Tax=Psilocybe cubensis TaxID=181762 RepID=A0A8H7XNH2_PSICU|nr:hypothetical protein JR316_0006823 [Psilocybe cubensis]KAH9480225.1 hypothetical protein JR316_0006823 [Psilocybe cubensis]
MGSFMSALRLAMALSYFPDLASVSCPMSMYDLAKHETKQAKKGVRKVQDGDSVDQTKKKSTLKGQLIHRFHQALKESQEDRAIGTGAIRKARWEQAAKGGQTGREDVLAGNSANAVAVATSQAIKSQRRTGRTKKTEDISYLKGSGT